MTAGGGEHAEGAAASILGTPHEDDGQLLIGGHAYIREQPHCHKIVQTATSCTTDSMYLPLTHCSALLNKLSLPSLPSSPSPSLALC